MFKNAIPVKDKKKKASSSISASLGSVTLFYFEELSLKIIGRGRCDEDILTD